MANPFTQQMTALLDRLMRLRKASFGVRGVEADSAASGAPVTVFGGAASADDPTAELTRVLDRLANSRNTVADLGAVEAAMYDGPEALRALPAAVLQRALLEFRFLMNGQPWTSGTRRLELGLLRRIDRLANGDGHDFAHRDSGSTGFGALHTASRSTQLREELCALINGEKHARAVQRTARHEPACRKPT